MAEVQGQAARRVSRRGASRPAPQQVERVRVERIEAPAPTGAEAPAPKFSEAPLEYLKGEAMRGGLLPRWFSTVRISGGIESSYTYNDRRPGDSRPLRRPADFNKYPDQRVVCPQGTKPPPVEDDPIKEDPIIDDPNIDNPNDDYGKEFGSGIIGLSRRPRMIRRSVSVPEGCYIDFGRKRDWKDLRDGRVQAGTNPQRVYDRRHNAGMLNQVQIRVEKDATEESPIGFGFRINGGKDSEVFRSVEEGTVDQIEAQEAYGSFRIPWRRGVTVSAGKLPSAVGAEVIEARDNFNKSRGLLFGLFQPSTVTGGRVAAPISDKVTVSGGILRGWDAAYEDNNSGETGEAKVTFTPTEKTSIAAAVMSGPEQRLNNENRRTLVDLVVNHKFSDTLDGYVNVDYITEEGAGVNGGGGDASGVSMGLRKKFGEKMVVTGRVEAVDDHDGARTGERQSLGSATLTGEYRFRKNVVGRVEMRHDTSSDSTFVSDRRPVSNQNTIATALLVSF